LIKNGLGCLPESLYVKNDAFAGARIDQKPCEPEDLTQSQLTDLFGHRSKSDGPDGQFDFSGCTGLGDFGLMLEDEIRGWDSSWRVAKRFGFSDARGQFDMVHCRLLRDAARTRSF
jgi:hypothetical protein